MTTRFEGRYAEMAERLRADGCDERTVERFVREEMEADESRRHEGITELAAFKEWMALSEENRRILLSSAFCPVCGMTSFAPGHSIRRVKWGLLIEGTCVKCGHKIARMREDV